MGNGGPGKSQCVWSSYRGGPLQAQAAAAGWLSLVVVSGPATVGSLVGQSAQSR